MHFSNPLCAGSCAFLADDSRRVTGVQPKKWTSNLENQAAATERETEPNYIQSSEEDAAFISGRQLSTLEFTDRPGNCPS